MQLSNIKALILRSENRAHSLASKIVAAGGVAHACPIMQVQNIPAPDLVNSLEQADFVIVLSANTIPALLEHGILLCRKQVFAVGSATATALQNIGVSEIQVPKQQSSEGLLEMTELHAVQNKKIVIVSGREGRTLLAEQLQQRGAKVQVQMVYRRVRANIPANQVAVFAKLMQQRQINVIVLHSVTLLEYFREIFAEYRPFWVEILCLAVSTRIANAARHDLHKVYVATSVADDAILAKLAEINKEFTNE